jgi:hypothetical protein
VCPRALNHAATGSHAGPVGSITTSSRVPGSAPSSAVASSAAKLSARGWTRRLASTRVPASRTCAVCAVAIPRSSPTRRRPAALSCIVLLSVRRRPARLRPLHEETRDHHRPTSAPTPRRARIAAAPTHVLQPGPGSRRCSLATRPAPLPSTGSSVASPGRHSAQRGHRAERGPQRRSCRLHPDQPGCHRAPRASGGDQPRRRLHEGEVGRHSGHTFRIP